MASLPENRPFFRGGNGALTAKQIIDDRAQSLSSINVVSFPPDVPKYYVVLYEHQSIFSEKFGEFWFPSNWKEMIKAVGGVVPDFSTWSRDALAAWWSRSWESVTNKFTDTFSARQLELEKAYRLPLPTHLIDSHEVQYDHSVNWASLAAQGLQTAGTGAIGNLGFALNNLKHVTLQSPAFRNYAMEWKMVPRTKQESDIIRALYLGIKRGMHPPTSFNRLVLHFPKIYWLAFMPNSGYLFKTKPSVITSISLDYAGGAAQPSFYADSGAPSGVVMRISFLELEYWMREDFNNADSSKNPFDGSTSVVKFGNTVFSP